MDQYGNMLGIYEPLKRTRDEVKAAPSFGGSAYGYGSTSGYPNFFGFAERHLDYSRTDPTASSIVMACLNWVMRNFGQARFRVVRRDGEDTTEIGGHALTERLANPNGWYSWQRLMAATLLDYNVDGNAYWLKQRPSIAAKPEAIWYMPTTAIRPVWPEDRDDIYISHYIHTNDRGERTRIDVEDIVHLTNGTDPRNQRMGLAPLKALMLEVFTDMEAGRFTAALLKNFAVPGVTITPKDAAGMDVDTAEAIKQKWVQRFGGDRKGEPGVFLTPMDVNVVGFSPDQMNLTELRRIPEERISGALGIPAIIAGLGAGISSMTKNDFEHAEAFAFQQNLVPTWYAIGEEITNQLLIDYTRDANVRAHFETGHIKALQENETDKQTRARENFMAGGLSRNQYREKIGEAAEDVDYILIPSGTKAVPIKNGKLLEPLTPPPAPEPLQLPPALDDEGRMKSVELKSVEWEGLQLSREPTDAERASVKAIAAAQEEGKARILKTLTAERERLINEASERLSEMKGAEYHTLVLMPDREARDDIRDDLQKLKDQGAVMVSRDLVGGDLTKRRASEPFVKSLKVDDDEELDDLADITLARVTNDVQARATGAAITLATLKLVGDAFKSRLRADLDSLSAAPQEQAAAAAAHRALADGRKAEMEARADEIDRYEYSALLDRNLCGPCSEWDGKTAESLDELPDTPFEGCEGGTLCRCFIIAVRDPEQKRILIEFRNVEQSERPVVLSVGRNGNSGKQ